MKEVYYFQHDYNARNDPKLQDVLIEHGAAGIGVFGALSSNYMNKTGSCP